MSKLGPTLTSIGLWKKRQQRCLAILERALLLLQGEESLPQGENDLNRRLYFCLLKASRELYPNELVSPICECNNQPDVDDRARAEREHKRPDFQWIYLDKYESDPQHSSKQFVVECKRLGKPERADWIFNSNYVDYGICRFRDREWAYAQRFDSGAMIGYVQSQEFDEVLNEVNQRSRAKSLTILSKMGQRKPKAVNRFSHEFERTFAISPFRLDHLWIDLRATQS